MVVQLYLTSIVNFKQKTWIRRHLLSSAKHWSCILFIQNILHYYLIDLLLSLCMYFFVRYSRTETMFCQLTVSFQLAWNTDENKFLRRRFEIGVISDFVQVSNSNWQDVFQKVCWSFLLSGQNVCWPCRMMPLVSHGDYADRTDIRTDGRTPEHYITLSAERSQRKNQLRTRSLHFIVIE